MQRNQGNLPGDDPIGGKGDIEKPYSVFALMPADPLSNSNVFFAILPLLLIVKLSALEGCWLEDGPERSREADE